MLFKLIRDVFTKNPKTEMYEQNQNFKQKQHNHTQISSKIEGYISEINFTAKSENKLIVKRIKGKNCPIIYFMYQRNN